MKFYHTLEVFLGFRPLLAFFRGGDVGNKELQYPVSAAVKLYAI